jgi:hypothetical protein
MAAAEFPPVEWVDGDPVRSTQFAFATGAFFGAGLSLIALYTWVLLGWMGVAPAAAFPIGVLEVLVFGILAVELPFLYLFPRRYPVIARLGFSPSGVQLRVPLRTLRLRWDSLAWAGPILLDANVGLGTQRYRLTERQAARLAWFVRSSGPTPSG